MTVQSLIRPNALHELMETARAAPAGMLVEVGVYQGGSAAALAQVAREQGRKLYLFDTFAGMPHADPGVDRHMVGEFADTSVERVRAAIPEAVCIPGVFPQTLPAWVDGVALAHIDCDQYRSVQESARALAPRMVPGGVMVFDDYDVLPGARRAVDELFGKSVELSAEGKARVRF
jgi:O-methyltransferase